MGSIGLTGLTGTQGSIGLTGLTGTQGSIGLTGLTGADGPMGTMGPIGLTGTMGSIGLTGLTGADGPMGTMGPIGLTGTQGPIGLTGADGPMGTMGPIGLTGSSFANLYVTEGITTGGLVVGLEGSVINLSSTGEISCSHLNVSVGATFGSLSIASEGVSASIDNNGLIRCSDIIPNAFSPLLTRATQETSIITGVNTYNNQFGSVLTVSSDLATQGSTAFVVQNSFVNENTRVISNIVNYTGTQGLPSVYVSNPTSGQFNLTLQNSSITDPLNGAVEIGFMALNYNL